MTAPQRRHLDRDQPPRDPRTAPALGDLGRVPPPRAPVDRPMHGPIREPADVRRARRRRDLLGVVAMVVCLVATVVLVGAVLAAWLGF